jgi:hypothetical protein
VRKEETSCASEGSNVSVGVFGEAGDGLDEGDDFRPVNLSQIDILRCVEELGS